MTEVEKTSKSSRYYTAEQLLQTYGEGEELTLDPAKPMPLNYSGEWDILTSHARLTKDKGSVAKWSQITGYSASRIRLSLNPLAQVGIEMGIIAACVAGLVGVVSVMPSNLWALTALILVGAVGGTSGGVVNLRKLFDEPREAARGAAGVIDREYKARVTRWAHSRYGVTLDADWADIGERSNKDMIHVGTKDGKTVYCYETPSGWVLGDLTGELPVIAKQLVEA